MTISSDLKKVLLVRHIKNMKEKAISHTREQPLFYLSLVDKVNRLF